MKSLASVVGLYLTERQFPSAAELSELEPLPVLDETELTREYDISLDLNRSRNWFVVLDQQLGLNWRHAKFPSTRSS
jgi:hypothetical protein